MAKRGYKLKDLPAEALSDPQAVFVAMTALARTWPFWLPQALVILVAALWIYSPAFTGAWLWDDDRYITGNRLMNEPAGFWKVWVNPDGQGNYYPLTSFAQWIQWHLWGNDTLGYHLTNVGLHLASAFLVWRLFARLGLPQAWLGGLLFTVHPIMIESVAWISELKNTLSLPPLLLAMLAWLAWEERGDRRVYFWSLGLFVAALLAKTSGLMLPVIFLAHAGWKRGRISRSDLWAAIPFFAIALVAGLVTLSPPHAAGGPKAIQPATWALASGLAGVGWSILFLLGKSLWPVGLLPAYPGYAIASPTAFDLLPWLTLGGLFCLLWLNRAGGGRAILFGVGFFIVNLVPVLVYVFMKYSIMVWSMDHLLYLPVIGLIGLVVAGFGYLDARLSFLWRTAGRAVVAALVMLMAWSGHSYAGWFAGPDILWNNLLRRDPANWLAQLNLGTLSLDRQRYRDALEHFQQVVRLRPDLDDGLYNLALAFDKEGRTAEAENFYHQTLKVNRDYANAYLNLGEIRRRQGNLAEAEAFFRQGLKRAPEDTSLEANLGGLLLETGRGAEAIELYEHAVQFTPDVAPLQYDLGVALLQAGRLAQAGEHLEAAVTLDPKVAAAHENLGVVLARLGHLSEAVGQFEAVLEIDPSYATARVNLALALAQSGRIPEAIAQLQQVLRSNPQDGGARQALAKLQALPAGVPAQP